MLAASERRKTIIAYAKTTFLARNLYYKGVRAVTHFVGQKPNSPFLYQYQIQNEQPCLNFLVRQIHVCLPFFCPVLPCSLSPFLAQKKMINKEEKAKVVAAAWGTELTQFLAALAILHQDDLKKRMNRRMDTWRNGCFMLWKNG